MQTQTIAEALRDGIREEMARDPDVFCIGEDIGIPGGFGGAFTVTLGLEELYRERILDTPIAELGFTGIAVGAAMMGMRPIADVQYSDFLFLAMDQIANNAAKLRYMSGGKISIPMVMRAPVGATGRGSQHAQNMERYFIGIPGIKVVTCSNAYDAKGLLKAAIRDDNPVMMFEHKLLYGSKGARAETGTFDASREIPDEDYIVPIGSAEVCREGADVTVIGWLLMLHQAMAAAGIVERDGIDAEVIDIRSLNPIDWETIGASVRKTGRVVLVEEGAKSGSVSAELATQIMERFPEDLLAPITRITSPDTPPPFSPVLENAYRPDAARIAQGIRDTVDYIG
jgi:pyruvate dehydrogenase E1 component beta subunit